MDPRTALATVAIVVSVASFGLTFWNTRRLEVIARRPILVFEFDRKVGWFIRNVGNGPALNVEVAQKRPGAGEPWFAPYQLPSIAKEGSFGIRWAAGENDSGFGAVYADFKGREYTSIVGLEFGSERNGFYEGRRLPRFEDVTPHWMA